MRPAGSTWLLLASTQALPLIQRALGLLGVALTLLAARKLAKACAVFSARRSMPQESLACKRIASAISRLRAKAVLRSCALHGGQMSG